MSSLLYVIWQALLNSYTGSVQQNNKVLTSLAQIQNLLGVSNELSVVRNTLLREMNETLKEIKTGLVLDQAVSASFQVGPVEEQPGQRAMQLNPSK